MQGNLSQHPLVEIFREIIADEWSGALRVSQERVKAVFYFERGALVYTISNLKQYRLAECLRRSGRVGDAKLQEVGAESMPDAKLAQTLLEQGLLDRATLDSVTTWQATELLNLTWQWATGEWQLEPRVRPAEKANISVIFRPLLLEAARKIPLAMVKTRLNIDTDSFSPDEFDLMNSPLQPNEAFVLTRVFGEMRLSDLLAVSGLPEDATLQAVYSLALGGYLKRNEWRSAFLLSLPENPAATATEDAAPMDAEAEAAARAKRELDSFFARMEVAQTFYDMLGVEKDVSNKSLKDIYYKLARRFHPDLFRGAEPSLRARVETEFARATRAYETLKDEAQRAKYDTKLAAQEASAILSGNKPQPPKPAPPPPPEVNPREPATEVKPPVSAPGQPINFTPPVVRPVRPTPPAPDANPVAPFLARDDNRRDAFQMPAKQDSFQMPPGRASTPQKVDLMMQNRAADQFQRGLAALASRDHIAAVACLAEAVRLDPTKARYHAYFGRALSNNAGARRQAEAELQEAIHLEPHNLDYYVMMAEFYWNAGFRLRAKGEIKRILEKDPFHPDARTLRDKLNAETLKK